MSHNGAKHDTAGAEPAFAVVGDGPLSDEAIAALATLLLDAIETELTDQNHTRRPGTESR